MERLKSRFGWALAGALGIILVLALARATVAGPLDPPGSVGSTMRTIDELMPSWGKTLTSNGACTSQRFTCVMNGAAVLDHETGIVWQRVPSAGNTSFTVADQTCREALIGGRHGWRLPTIDELLSLDDETTADSLPVGHPFTNTPDTYLWSQTADTTDPQLMQTMTFLNGGNGFSIEPRSRFTSDASNVARPWCARGGSDSGSSQIPDEQPAWWRRLSATAGCNSARFKCVLPTNADFAGAAVLDVETGLVWEKSIGTDTATFSGAQVTCASTPTGDVTGWRVPTLSELYTLLDPTRNTPSFSGPALPVGHPFQNVPTTGSHIWSTTVADSTNAWAMRFGNWPGQTSETQITSLSTSDYVFCVRGAM